MITRVSLDPIQREGQGLPFPFMEAIYYSHPLVDPVAPIGTFKTNYLLPIEHIDTKACDSKMLIQNSERNCRNN